MRVRCLVLALFVVVGLSGCGKSEAVVEEPVSTDAVLEAESTVEAEIEEISTEEPTQEEIPVIYEEDEHINLYLVRYNKVNEDPIAREDFEIYYHHGSNHKDQIVFNSGTVNEIVVSNNVGKIEVVIQGAETDEAYKEAFIQYARGYNVELSVEVLEGYWEQIIEKIGMYVQFDEFEVYTQSSYDGSIELIKISGGVE